MYLVDGQSVIYGEMVVVVAEVCAEVHMFVKTNIPRRHAQSCKGKSSFRRPMVWVNVQHQPLDSNPVVMMGLSVVVFIISSLLWCCCCFDLFHLARWCTTLCPASIFKSMVTVFPLLMASYMFGQQIWEALLHSLCFLCAILSLYSPFGWMLSSKVLYIICFKKPLDLHLFSRLFLPDEMPRNNIIRPYFGKDGFLIIFFLF